MPIAFTEEEQEQIREQLFLKGIRLIVKFGLQRTTVDKLTKECGIAKGSFYLFYDSKESYLAALAEYADGRMREMLRRHLAGRSRMTCAEFRAFFEEFLYSDYDLMGRLTVEDFLWIRTHMRENYFDPEKQLPTLEKCLTLISDVRDDLDLGTIVNLVKCIYAMREHRDTMVETSIDRSISLILDTLQHYMTGK